MNKRDLKKLSKSQLINMLLKQSVKPKIIVVDDTKPVPAPRKSVKDMVKKYEENIILPPPEFRDNYKPIPAPRTYKPVPAPRTYKPVPAPKTYKPVPASRTKPVQKSVLLGPAWAGLGRPHRAGPDRPKISIFEKC